MLRCGHGEEDLRGGASTNVPAKTGQQLIASPFFGLLPEAEAMEIDDEAPAASGEAGPSAPTVSVAKKYTPPIDSATNDLIPEAVVYLRLLLLLAALDAGKVAEAGAFALETTELIQALNRRTMDQIAAKIYFYLARAYELQDRLAELRPTLLAVRQTAKLRKDETLEVG